MLYLFNLGLYGRGSILDRGKRFSLLDSIQTGSGDHPASYQWVPGALSPWVKRQGREADYSLHLHLVPKSRVELYPIPMSSWHSAQLIKQRDNFNFAFTYLTWPRRDNQADRTEGNGGNVELNTFLWFCLRPCQCLRLYGAKLYDDWWITNCKEPRSKRSWPSREFDWRDWEKPR
jgi:hypothetical protein